MKTEIYNKEYTIGEIFSESWRSFRENFQSILLMILVVYTPINIILAFVPLEGLVKQGGPLRGFSLYMRCVGILEGLIGIIATMAIAYIVKSKIEGQVVTFSQALKISLSKWLRAVGTNIVLHLFLFGLFLLLIVPAIIYYVYWIFTIYALVLQDKTWNGAMDYSKAIVKNRWWKVFRYSFVFGLIGILMMSFVGIFASGVLGVVLPNNFFINAVSEVVSNTIVDVIHSFFFTVVFTIFFINFDSVRRLLPTK